MTVGAIFSAWRNSIPHLCFICTSMSDAILSGCPSAAICHMATTCSAIWTRRFSLYCYTTTSTSDTVTQYNKTGGITFGAALMIENICHWFMGWFGLVTWLTGWGDPWTPRPRKRGRGRKEKSREMGQKQKSSNNLSRKSNLLSQI